MRNVGESKNRNKEFSNKYNRENLIQSIVRQEKPICIDIGAHQGESVKYFIQLFNKPIIFSFEPSPKSFNILKNKKFPNNHCFNFAISNETGMSPFYENEISHTNSLLKINNSSKDTIKKQKNINSPVFVKTITLDEFINEHKIENIDLLKVDVQGAESYVLKGGLETLKIVKVLIIEVSFFDYYEKKSSFFEIEKILKPNNFDLFSISEISHNPMNGRTDWAEVIYVKSDI